MVAIVNIIYDTDKLKTGGYFRIIFIWEKIMEKRRTGLNSRWEECLNSIVTWSGWKRTVNMMKKIAPNSTRIVLEFFKVLPLSIWTERDRHRRGQRAANQRDLPLDWDRWHSPSPWETFCFYLNLSQDSEGLGKSGSCHKIPSVLRKWVQRWL